MKNNNKFKIDVAILGARMHYAVPKILAKNNMLHKMYTDFFLGNKIFLLKFFSLLNTKSNLIKAAKGRQIKDIEINQIISFDILGLYKKYLSKFIKDGSDHARLIIKISKKFNKKMSKFSFEGVDAIYGFNVSSLEIFELAKEKNMICILEQMSSAKKVEQEILQLEKSRYQEIDDSLYLDLNHPYIKREEKEWKLADIIIVPSSFVLKGIVEMGVDKTKCHLIPYGVSTDDFKFTSKKREKPFVVLNVLFVGKVGIHKGAHYVLDAVRNVKNIDVNLKLAGAISFSDDYLAQFDENIEFLGMIPRLEIMKLYEWADVFVFPSLCEGSATVVYEAIASGLPVITTENSGSIISNEQNGCIVPIRNSVKITQKLEQMSSDINYYNKLLNGVKETLQDISLENYEKNLLKVIQDFRSANEKNI